MGRLRKGYNWRARTQNKPSKSDNSEVKKIKLDISVQAEKYDACNALVLPSSTKKQKASQKLYQKPQKKPLTKKQKKKLEQILQTREKKKNRAQLLEKLQECQASRTELEKMMSISSMQTKGLKRHFLQKKSKKSLLPTKDTAKTVKDPNVVGLDQSSSSDSDGGSDSEDSVAEDVDKSEEAFDSPEDDTNPQPPSNVSEEKTELGVSEESKKQCSETAKGCDSPVCTPKIQTKYTDINRKPEIQEARLKLPILSEEQVIMEAIYENPVVVICGETGSGKTTQVPQFLYEAGYTSAGMIGVTEPRRIAAISMSKRVAKEMNLTNKEVSYLIRFSGNVSDDTKVKFMTDGVLLKEIQNDFLLSRYSVIIIDEAHERSVYSDILIGLLSRIVPLRNKKGKPLKLIIMSATLRVEDFTENKRLFKVPPAVLKVDSRQFPVTIHFNKRTVEDYLSEAFKKVCKIHQQLPEGGILVFVTGQQEVHTLCRKLRQRFPKKYQSKGSQDNEKVDPPEESNEEQWDEAKAFKMEGKASYKKDKVKSDILPRINLDDYAVEPLDEDQLQETDHIANDEDEDLPDGSSDEDEEDISAHPVPHNTEPLFVLPLFSLLPPEKQALVFAAPPAGMRLCVVATNVAETSLTIPNIRYVVDTGKTKTRLYDKVTGVSAFDIVWTSKASANQRAGRAGRTGPGHCYRLYSSAVFSDEFSKFSVPEIIRRPVDDLLLQMKAMGIDKVINFPFPTPPAQESLKAAEKRLLLLGALEERDKHKANKEERSSSVTALGRAMASFPLSPRYAKMLALSHQHNLLPYMIAIISALTIQEVLMEPTQDETVEGDIAIKEKHRKWKQMKMVWAGQGSTLALGDVMVLLKAVGASEFAGCTREFCERHGLRHKAMTEIRKLRQQITNEVNLAIPDLNLFLDPQMSPPSDLQCRLLRQLVLTGMVDHLAKKVKFEELSDEEKLKARNAYQCLDVEDYVFIHPKSVLHKELPEYVMYQEIFETSKMYMRVVSAVDVNWLPIYAPQLCTFSEPMSDPPPRYDPDGDRILCHCTSTFGCWAWPIPAAEVEFPEGLDYFRWFACCFLEGQVCEKLKPYADLLLAPAKVMVKSWAKLQQRTETLLQALVSKHVTSKFQLQSVWQKNKSYLLNEYRQWLPESVHYEVGQLWPPIS